MIGWLHQWTREELWTSSMLCRKAEKAPRKHYCSLSVLKGPSKKYGACCDRTSGDGFKLKEGIFSLDKRLIFFTRRVAKLWHRLPREVADMWSLVTAKVMLDSTLSRQLDYVAFKRSLPTQSTLLFYEILGWKTHFKSVCHSANHWHQRNNSSPRQGVQISNCTRAKEYILSVAEQPNTQSWITQNCIKSYQNYDEVKRKDSHT